MIYATKNPIDADRLRKAVEKQIARGDLVENKTKHPQRTRSQNSYLHLLLGWFGCEMGCPIDYVKQKYFKLTCNRDIFLVDMNDPISGKTEKWMRSSADLTTEEMTIAIERFRKWSLEEGGLYLPEANEYEYLTEIEKEIENQKRYL